MQQTIREQAEGILALRHAQYRHPNKIDPKLNQCKMAKIDTIRADIDDAKRLDSDSWEDL